MALPWNRPAWCLLAIACTALIVAGCTSAPGDDDDADALVDSDGDGLYDTFEAEIETDAELEDTDADGYLDGAEWEMFTDPLDPEDFEYLDGNGQRVWEHYPFPFGLEGTGSAYGDVVEDFALPNYWVQQVHLYSFYGNVIQVVSTADS